MKKLKHKKTQAAWYNLGWKYNILALTTLLILAVIAYLIATDKGYSLTLVHDGKAMDLHPRTDVEKMIPHYKVKDTAVIVYTYFKTKASPPHRHEWRLAQIDETYETNFKEGDVVKDTEEVRVQLYRAIVTAVPERSFE